MCLLEAIIEANHRAAAGHTDAGLHPADFADSLPLVALTCIDSRLNLLIPEVLGIPEEQFIWLRNAGNIITGALSSTMRSLALACAIKNGKEIVILGHTDCLAGKTGVMELTERFKSLGVGRSALPENLTEFFSLFASERQNVMRGVEHVRHSPLISPKVPVHGLLLDTATGRVEWIVNGYQEWTGAASKVGHLIESVEETADAIKGLADFQIGEMKFPETKIGETVVKAANWVSGQMGRIQSVLPTPPGQPTEAAKPPTPPKLPHPFPDRRRRALRMRSK